MHKRPCLADKLLDVKLATVPRACLMEGYVGVCELDGEDMRQTPSPTVSAQSQGGKPQCLRSFGVKSSPAVSGSFNCKRLDLNF